MHSLHFPSFSTVLRFTSLLKIAFHFSYSSCFSTRNVHMKCCFCFSVSIYWGNIQQLVHASHLQFPLGRVWLVKKICDEALFTMLPGQKKTSHISEDIRTT